MTSTLEKKPAVPQRRSTLNWQRIAGSDGLVTVLAIVIALVIGAILMVFSDDRARSDLTGDVGAFFPRAWSVVSGGYSALFRGAIFDFGNHGSFDAFFDPIASSISEAAPLILAGLGITLAFRAGLFNIGAEGQITIGAACAGAVGFGLSLPPFLHLVAAIVAGLLGGAAWGLIVGFLKAKTGAHEVITTIMMNYVARFAVLLMLNQAWFQGTDNQQSKVVDGNARLPHLFGDNLGLDLSILLAIAAAAFLWWLLSRSTAGFRLRAVGQNPAAARTAGMNIGNVTMLAMAIAGGLAGLAGVTLVLGDGNSNQVTDGLSSNLGFDAITVALLGRMRPWPTLWAGLLFGVLRAGGTTMQADVSIPVDIVLVMQAVIVVFIAAPKLTRGVFRIRAVGRAMQTATTNLAVTVKENATSPTTKRVRSGLVQIVLGVLALVIFGLGSRAGNAAEFVLSRADDTFDLGGFAIQARPVIIVLSVLTILAGVARLLDRVPARYCAAVSVVALLVSFIFWSVAGADNGLNVATLVKGTVFPGAIPLILGAIAGVIGERAGVVNVALEGQLLLGAFAAALVGTVAGSALAGAIAGAAAGLLVAAILAVLAIRYLVDQVIVGVVLNVFVLGLTSFLYNKMLQPQPDRFNTPPALPDNLVIPGLSDIPIIGSALFEGSIFLYLMYVVVALAWFSLFRTRWGLRLRAVGEHPRAADTVGVKVLRTRYRAVWLAGIIAGLGGAALILGTGGSTSFGLNTTDGRGFIALAAVIFGRWHPRGAVLAALLFGFSYQLQSLLQGVAPIDENIMLAAPYVVTILAVAGFIGRSRPPAADGQPYTSRS